jgi:2-keto-4-pentenoate hydratase/2-oxohepta-3-ene-1,7-dioic acid hydratase in catechol pathway
VRIALFQVGGAGLHVGVVDGEELIDLTDSLGPLGTCPLATYLTRAADGPPAASGKRVPVEDVVWLPPALGATAVLCVGVNYADHAEEARNHGINATQQPALFSRYWHSLVGHLRPIVRPRLSEQLDFEGELVVVIGKRCRAVPRERALDVVAGYTIGQEGSVRDWQRQAPTPTAGKNFARSGSLGPWMVTSDRLRDPAALHLMTRVNGELMQESDTALMIHDVPALIEHITAFMPLSPGDVIFTGTPAGSFAARNPARWLAPGDVVSVEISGIGQLQNQVIDEDDTAAPVDR